jgi:hypothetical protein
MKTIGFIRISITLLDFSSVQKEEVLRHLGKHKRTILLGLQKLISKKEDIAINRVAMK